MSEARAQITYGSSEEAWVTFDRCLRELFRRESIRRVWEVGGGARPALSLEFAEEAGIEDTITDISRDELDKAPGGYIKLHADVTRAEEAFPRDYDLVFSRLVAEHVHDPA